MIRLNLSLQHSTRRPEKKLLFKWAELLAEAYCVRTNDAGQWVTDPHCLEFVAEFLRSKGWKVGRIYHTAHFR